MATVEEIDAFIKKAWNEDEVSDFEVGRFYLELVGFYHNVRLNHVPYKDKEVDAYFQDLHSVARIFNAYMSVNENRRILRHEMMLRIQTYREAMMKEDWREEQ